MLFPIDVGAPDPSKIAFQMCETSEQVTYAQLDVRANQVARVLRSCGASPGDHVAVLMKNHRRFLEACFGMNRCGVYYTTISTRLASTSGAISSSCVMTATCRKLGEAPNRVTRSRAAWPGSWL